MRDRIKNILKEAREFHNSVFLIMSEDEKFVKYNIHVGGEKYFNGGPNEDGWESVDMLNNKNLQEFYLNQRSNAESMINIMPQPQLDRYKPKAVEYLVGFFKKEDDVNDLFNKLNESHVEHDESVFYNGGDPVWDRNFREGVSYMFIVDNDELPPVYWVKDDINSWRPFSAKVFNSLFSRFDYDVTSKLFESEDDDLEWARDVVSNPFNGIKIGDVFYIVDTDSDNPKPDSYKPVRARYIFVVTNIEEGGKRKFKYGISDEIFLKSKYCTPDDATYNSDDYYETSPKCRGFEEEGEAYNLTGINWAKHLIDLKYWRKM